MDRCIDMADASVVHRTAELEYDIIYYAGGVSFLEPHGNPNLPHTKFINFL